MACAAQPPEMTDTMLFILTNVEHHYGTLPPMWWAIKTRKREVVTARHIAMYMIDKYTDLSLANIGAFCGRRDHTTVIHGKRNVENLRIFDRFMCRMIDRIDSDVATYVSDAMTVTDDSSTFWPRGAGSAVQHIIA
jgi:chromosomal replication initiation ATPase DnaA